VGALRHRRESGYEVPRDYDSMIGKLIVWGEDRDAARHRMARALDELVLEGIPTTVPFHRLAMTNEQFAAGEHSTVSVETEWDLSGLEPQGPAAPATATDGPSREVTVEVGGRRLEVKVFGELAAAAAGGGAAAAGSHASVAARGSKGGGGAAARRPRTSSPRCRARSSSTRSRRRGRRRRRPRRACSRR
jgi:acetyl-CoA/propionyl-CoA carboxylase, biotin carboxylase, biotin carboxyl carrier protein